MGPTSAIDAVHTDDTTSTTGHHTWLLTPVRSGERRTVSARCSCGWRAVGVAPTRDDAVGRARALSAEHVASAPPVVPVPTPGEPATPVGLAPTRPWAYVVAAVLMAVALAGGLDLLVTDGLALTSVGR